MIRFNCDYLEGAHPRIIEALTRINMEQTVGYGCDEYCDMARDAVKKVCGDDSIDVHFLVGGTQTNLTVISSALRAHQGVLSAETGHINCHETGAIEATGHKVISLPTENGKIKACDIDAYVERYRADDAWEHVVQPKMVYISNPTETGTIYTKAELTEISESCRRNGLYLFLDGARLGYGLACKRNDLDIPTITALTDVFYIGGTKVGLLFGECLVITNPALKEDFRCVIKQKGGMLAKGRLLGVQFYEMFRDGLYFEISEHAMTMAEKLKSDITALGYEFDGDSPTNQQFVKLTSKQVELLSEDFSFENMGLLPDGRVLVRFCTSWATKEENIDKLIEKLKEIREV
ncbi:MAG: aminotransferase class I/II-fold pyridoxal phosphate-dependent enzyme [Clostridia bacterium]|nr:aminotransferase class I/II-fold pyridoxal phosphate-dependent enzyme [Clostridia bacterium]